MSTAFRHPDGARELPPSRVHAVLREHLLVDGFDLVLDLDRSRGGAARRPTGRHGLPRHVRVLRVLRARDEPPRHRRRPGVHHRTRRGRREQAEQLRHLHRGDGPVRRHLRPGARRPGPAAPVLRRRWRTRGGERTQGGLRLEEPAQRGSRTRLRPRGQRSPPLRGVPRPHRLHDVPHQHGPGEDGPVPQVPLAAHRRALPGRRPRRRGRRGARTAAGAPGVRREPARHRVFHRRTHPGRGRRPPLPARVLPGHGRTVPPARCAADLRRGADRRRADRKHMGVPAVRRHPPTSSPSGRRPRSAASWPAAGSTRSPTTSSRSRRA